MTNRAGVQPLMDLAELGQWLERLILKVLPTEMSLRFHDLWSIRSTTVSVHSLNLSLQEQQQIQSASPALILPVGRSDVESTQLAWKCRLGAVVRVEPGWLVMLHVQHLLVFHEAAPRSMGYQSPALGRATVLERKKAEKLRFIVCDVHGGAVLGHAVCSSNILCVLWKTGMCSRKIQAWSAVKLCWIYTAESPWSPGKWICCFTMVSHCQIFCIYFSCIYFIFKSIFAVSLKEKLWVCLFHIPSLWGHLMCSWLQGHPFHSYQQNRTNPC